MHKRILAMLLSLGLLLTFAPIVSAAVQGPNCGSDAVFVYLYENSAGDTSDGNDILSHCANSNADLSGTSHTLPGNCHAAPVSQVTWNNCTSSILIQQPSSYSFCGYSGANYHGLIADRKGASVSRETISSDVLTSFKMINTGPTGSCPAT